MSWVLCSVLAITSQGYSTIKEGKEKATKNDQGCDAAYEELRHFKFKKKDKNGV